MNIDKLPKFCPKASSEPQRNQIEQPKSHSQEPLSKMSIEKKPYANWIIKGFTALVILAPINLKATASFLETTGAYSEVIAVIKAFPDFELRDKKLIEFSQKMEIQGNSTETLNALREISDPALQSNELINYAKRTGSFHNTLDVLSLSLPTSIK